MPSKREFPVFRRTYTGAIAGFTLTGLLAIGAIGAVPAALRGDPGARPFLAVATPVVVLALIVLVAFVRRGDRAYAQQLQEYRDSGRDDGLPLGAFRRDQRIGLDANDAMLVFGVVFVGIAVLFFGIGESARPDLPLVDLAIAGFPLLGALLFFRFGTSTPYWLTPEGIVRRNRQRLLVRWADIEEIVPYFQSSKTDKPAIADGFRLMEPKEMSERWRLWGRPGVSVNANRVEIDSMDLFRLLKERVDAAHGKEPPPGHGTHRAG